MRGLIVAIVALATVAQAAPIAVRGVVLVAHSPQPIAGAAILTDHGELTASDSDGFFTVVLDPRDHQLTIVAPGYITRTVEAGADDEMLHVELEKAQGAEVIEVYGRAPEETKPLSYQITADEVRSIPGAFNDVLRAAQVLPGVARIPYAFGGLVLRGTSPRDTEVYLDGIEVPIAFHFGGITSFYPSSMLSDLQLTAGGFDASYGRAQGGIITLATREPRRDRWRVGGSVGLLDSGAFAEGPLWGGGVEIGVRRSYFDTVASPFVSADTPLPSYWDFQLRTSWGDPRDNGRITPMIFGSIDRVASNALSVTSAFVRIAAPYTKQWGELTLHVVPWLGVNDLTFAEASDDGTTDQFSRPMYPGGLRADLSRDYAWGHLRGGLETTGGYLARTQVNAQDLSGHMETNGVATSAWLDEAVWTEARFKVDGDRLAVKPGLRIEHYGLTDEVVIDPRFNLHEQLDDTITLRQAIGRYHQPPTPADVDKTDGNPALKSSYTDQFSLGIDKDFGDHTSASFTGFFEYGQSIGVRVQPPAQGTPAVQGDTPEPDYGGLGPTFELLLEKQLGFPIYPRQRRSRAQLRARGPAQAQRRQAVHAPVVHALEVGAHRRSGRHAGSDAGVRDLARRSAGGRSSLDQTHNLNLAIAYQLTNWRLGARVQIVSGNPYTPTTLDLIPAACRSSTRGPATSPTFFSLDVRADRRWHRCWGDIDLFIDIQNATNNANVEGRDFSARAWAWTPTRLGCRSSRSSASSSSRNDVAPRTAPGRSVGRAARAARRRADPVRARRVRVVRVARARAARRALRHDADGHARAAPAAAREQHLRFCTRRCAARATTATSTSCSAAPP